LEPLARLTTMRDDWAGTPISAITAAKTRLLLRAGHAARMGDAMKIPASQRGRIVFPAVGR
jgi:hypothetical protein